MSAPCVAARAAPVLEKFGGCVECKHYRCTAEEFPVNAPQLQNELKSGGGCSKFVGKSRTLWSLPHGEFVDVSPSRDQFLGRRALLRVYR